MDTAITVISTLAGLLAAGVFTMWAGGYKGAALWCVFFTVVFAALAATLWTQDYLWKAESRDRKPPIADTTRPWLTLEATLGSPMRFTKGEVHLALNLKAVNVGKTPAEKVIFLMRLGVTGELHERITALIDEASAQVQGKGWPVNENFGMTLFPDKEAAKRLPHYVHFEEIRKSGGSFAGLSFVGLVGYLSQSGAKHHTVIGGYIRVANATREQALMMKDLTEGEIPADALVIDIHENANVDDPKNK